MTKWINARRKAITAAVLAFLTAEGAVLTVHDLTARDVLSGLVAAALAGLGVHQIPNEPSS